MYKNKNGELADHLSFKSTATLTLWHRLFGLVGIGEITQKHGRDVRLLLIKVLEVFLQGSRFGVLLISHQFGLYSGKGMQESFGGNVRFNLFLFSLGVRQCNIRGHPFKHHTTRNLECISTSWSRRHSLHGYPLQWAASS